MHSALITCCLALSLMSCNLTSASSNVTNRTDNSNPGKSSGTPIADAAKGNFSTPRAAVETFIAAGTNRDKELLSQCFASESAGEFRKYREKTASQKEMDELARFVEGGHVVDVKEKGDQATVSAQFKERSEEITLKKLAGGWKILDF